ncbi:multidrug efflux SMR transporter [Adlercreutzia sp. ZJ242]|uniref:DMT family transporter n=1 Tax=Adlercreutzia sp. ZJ242 TaxID=2709409 RepID=UPI0013EE1100|nr:multidrug efflux SMR transporter [Adlercreutzia sp. ZJ242]
MDWIVLVGAGVMESVWAVSLDKSQGFTQMLPTVVFAIALVLSMLGLSFALKTLPVGTAYAVWVGIGAALTVVYGMVTGIEPVSIAKIALLAGLVACIIGLKLVGGDDVAA